MLSKLIQLSGRSGTIKLLASLIIITFMIMGTYQWLVYEPNLSVGSTLESTQKLVPSGMDDSNKQRISKPLTDWVINVVNQLNWQQTGGSRYLNAFVLFTFLSLTTSIGLPRQIAALVAGMNLGALTGMLVATLATTLGCLITFSISRYLFSEKITRKYPDQLAKLSAFLDEQTFFKALIIRILPLGSNFLTNIIAGVSKVSMPAYVSGSFVGFIPQMIIFSLAGSGIRLGAKYELVASIILFIIALLLSAYLVKKHRAKLN